MIQGTPAWVFREGLDDNGSYADQLMDHTATGLIARRRVFGERVSGDERLSAIAEARAREAAACASSRVPKVLAIERVEGRLCITTQHFHGEPLSIAVRRGGLEDPRKWARRAREVARFAIALQQARVAFDRLRLEGIIDYRGTMALAEWAPMGPLGPEDCSSGSLAEKLAAAPGGRIVGEGAYPLAEGLRRLADLLFQLAVGKGDASLDEAIARAEASKAIHGGGIGVETPIERILLRLRDQTRGDRIASLEDLDSELAALAGRTEPAAEPAPEPAAAAATPATQPKPAASGRAAAIAAVGSDDPLFRDAKARAAAKQHPARSWIATSIVGVAFLGLAIGAYFVVAELLRPPVPNEPPVALFTAGSTALAVRELTPIDGSASSDPEGAGLEFEWTIVTPAGAPVDRADFRIVDRQAEATSVQFFEPGEFVLRLRVWDGALWSEYDEALFTVSPAADDGP